MAESVLTPYRDDIARLYFERRQAQAEIMRYLEQAHGIRTNKATLSRFIKSLPEAGRPISLDEPNISPDEERLMEKVEILEGVRARLDELVEQAVKTHARLEVLEDAAAERHADMLRQMKAGQNTGGQLSHGVMVRVWKRAALYMGLAWGILVLLGVLGWFWWSQPEAKAVPKPPAKQETPVKKR